MNDSELEEALKSAPVPERPRTYWAEFPLRVMARAQRLETHSEPGARRPRAVPFGPSSTLGFAAFGVGLMVIALLLSFAFGWRQGRPEPITGSQLTAARKCFREIEALFPNQVQAIVFDQDGPRLVLAEEPNVPASVPLYVRIRGPKGSRNYVTFSGQQIRFNGEVCEVLLNHLGHVLLVGHQAVWSPTQALVTSTRYQVAACPLETTL
jgi:hypothetical protein